MSSSSKRPPTERSASDQEFTIGQSSSERPDGAPHIQTTLVTVPPLAAETSAMANLPTPVPLNHDDASSESSAPRNEPSVEPVAVARLRALVQAVGSGPAASNPSPFPSSAPSPFAGTSATETMDSGISNLLSPPEGPGEIGRLGGYRVLSVLGRGGMGLVLAGEDPRLGRAVALKVMLPELAVNPSARERFFREAHAAAQIEHENIIPIWQVAEDRGMPFLAMPLLSGVSLDDALKMGRPLPLSMTLPIARQIAAGLAAAHAKGLIHRDIKPSNIWLEMAADGAVRRVRILDFGLARLGDDSELTKSGVILGTPAYMAPEQARGWKVDARADLFSFGVVLYQMVTGKRPFRGSDALSVLTALATDTPTPVRQLNPAVPPALANLIDRLMAKQPDLRPKSAEEVFEQLRLIEAGDSRAEPVKSGGWFARRRRRLAAFAVALAGVGGIAAYSGTIVRIVSNTGELLIETHDPHIEVVVTPEGGAVINDRKLDRRFVLTAGKGVVQFRDPVTGVVAPTERFTIERGGKTVVSAVVPKPAPVPVDPHPMPTMIPMAEPDMIPPVANNSKPLTPDVRRALDAITAAGGKVVFVVNGVEQTVVANKGTVPSGDCQIREVRLDDIQEITEATISHLGRLTNILGMVSFQGSNLTDDQLSQLAGSPAAHTITQLTLSRTQVTEAGLNHLTRFPMLNKLMIEQIKIGKSGLAVLGKLSTLKRLRVTGAGINTAGLRELHKLSLTSLDIREAPNLDESAYTVIAEQKELQELVIFRSLVTDTAINTIAELPKLNSLNVSAERLTDTGIEQISEMKTLVLISLPGYTASADSLARLSNIPGLAAIDLSWSKLKPADFEQLRAVKGLRSLRLLGFQLTDDESKSLNRALPHTRIDFDGGVIRAKS